MNAADPDFNRHEFCVSTQIPRLSKRNLMKPANAFLMFNIALVFCSPQLSYSAIFCKDKLGSKEVQASERWIRQETQSKRARVVVPDAKTITDGLLEQAERFPDRVVAEENGDSLTYRELLLRVMAVMPTLERIPEKKIGLMLPSSTGSLVMFTALMYAGKIPVMLNFTLGPATLKETVDGQRLNTIITSSKFISVMSQKGSDGKPRKDFSNIQDKFLWAEDIKSELTLAEKLSAKFRATFSHWNGLRRHVAQPNDTAFILFTSGSSSTPKAVPKTHLNIMSQVGAFVKLFDLRDNDSFMNPLPSFHIFGTLLQNLSLVLGIPEVLFANPSDGKSIGELIGKFKTKFLFGTPGFHQNIFAASTPEQLASLRVAISGAQAMPSYIEAQMKEKNPTHEILEGYGTTETGILAVNLPGQSKQGSLGKIIPGVDWLILDSETLKEIPKDKAGLFLVAGDMIFPGYDSAKAGSNPFVEIRGRKYYNTGDIVQVDADNYAWYKGRASEFFKFKNTGEMISPATIEAAIGDLFATTGGGGVNYAVTGIDGGMAVLFTTTNIDIKTVNAQIEKSGLSRISQIGEIIKVRAIPVSGTGKVDKKPLKAYLETKTEFPELR